jgi:cell division protein FtsQ
LKTFFNILFWIILLALLLTVLGFTEIQHNSRVLQKINVHIETKHNNYFVEEDDILTILSNVGLEESVTLLKNIELPNLEKLINANSSILKTEIYTTIDGNLWVDVEQRKPILRIFNKKNESYYIDENGWLMPLSNKFTAHVLVANGNILEGFASNYQFNVKNFESSSILQQLYEITLYLEINPFWKAQIVQIFVNEKNEIELIPRIGNHNIILGDVTDLEDKMNKLKIFYEKGIHTVGWNEYKTINLKYKNQIVCTKK